MIINNPNCKHKSKNKGRGGVHNNFNGFQLLGQNACRDSLKD